MPDRSIGGHHTVGARIGGAVEPAVGMSPQDAVDRAIRLFPRDVGVGVIAISGQGCGGGGNYGDPADFRENMAWGMARVRGLGPRQ
ncbi:MAG: hypothetical protein FJW24_10605 [Acidimicrobiia bacterium]|nr:hypothetical protein [Acidimicrobiia bacterium]